VSIPRMYRRARSPRFACVWNPQTGEAIAVRFHRKPAALCTLARALWNGTGSPWTPGTFTRIGARI
jgi:hypothetical protein